MNEARWAAARAVLGVVGLFAVIGCGPSLGSADEPTSDPPASSVDTGGTTAGPGGTVAAETIETPATTAGDPLDPDGDTSAPDGGDTFPIDAGHPVPPACDFFAQDCPAGNKCVPYGNDGRSAWNSTRCVPIAADPHAAGDSCAVEAFALSGFDDCDADSLCWNVDPSTLEGTCHAFCGVGDGPPICDDPDTACVLTELVGLCPSRCDPLIQDCGAAGLGCYPGPDEGGFVCLLDGSGDGGAPGTPCELLNGCDPGAFCLPPAAVPGCDGPVGCCSSVCDLAEPMSPCFPGQTCESWIEEGTFPGLWTVGVCTAP